MTTPTFARFPLNIQCPVASIGRNPILFQLLNLLFHYV
jgi:hypothetical protein